MALNFTSTILSEAAHRAKALQEKTIKKGARVDLCISDHRIRKTADSKKLPVVDLLLEYTPYHGTPRPSEIVAFVRNKLDKKVQVVPETVIDYNSQGCLTVSALILPEIAFSSDSKFRDSLTFLSRNAAVDEAKNVWDVEESPSGKKILKRIDAEAIEALLKQRQSIRRNRSFTNLRQGASQLQIEIGDKVSFMSKMQKPLTGDVTSVSGNMVTIKAQPGREMHTIPCESVLAIVNKGEKGLQESKEVVRKYWNDLLPGYGDKLVAQTKDLARKPLR